MWDEIVLACDLVARNGWRQLPAENPQVIELSELLRRMTLHPEITRSANFRNPDGVAWKTLNIASCHPDYRGSRTNGNSLDEKVLSKFLSEPDVMHALAEATRNSVTDGEPPDFPREVGYENESAMEGRYLLRWHVYLERKPVLRRRKIHAVLAKTGSLTCEVCRFDFARTYGERGRGYIECHHIEPLHVGGEGPRTIRDLALLCSNCHRMIHTKPPWPTPEELREIIQRQAANPQG